jgi:hypothetical protein
MTFNLDVYDNAGIASVTATIKYPNGTTANQQVTYDSGTKWKGGQLNLTTVGDYWLNITATDVFSLKNSTIGWFDVYTPVFFDGLLDGALAHRLERPRRVQHRDDFLSREGFNIQQMFAIPAHGRTRGWGDGVWECWRDGKVRAGWVGVSTVSRCINL